MTDDALLARIADGRTDLAGDFVARGDFATAEPETRRRLLESVAYYGDVSALRLLLQHGASLASLGDDLGLRGAAFHGHWRLCEFLLEAGADANAAAEDTGETPLHSALCAADRDGQELVVRALLAHGADPNRVTKPSAETGCFMRDCRTKAETPLHRAAAFGSEATIDLLLRAGAALETRDMNGDTPLSWGSWYGRPDAILRRLCYGPFTIQADRRPMRTSLSGRPHGRSGR